MSRRFGVAVKRFRAIWADTGSPMLWGMGKYDDLRPEYARSGTARPSVRDLAMRAAAGAVVTCEVLPEVAALVTSYAGPTADEARVAAALNRVRAEVPGPFEAPWPGTDGAGGAAEYRRRYGGTDARLPLEQVADERVARDRAQVRGLLIRTGVRA